MPSTALMSQRLLSTVRNPWTYMRDRQGWMQEPEVRLSLHNGLTAILRSKTSDRYVFNDIWLERVYDLSGLRFNTYHTIIDIGAHIGLFALYAAHHSPQAQIYAYEPEPQNVAILQRNIEENHLKERVHISPQGIAEKAGSLQLHVVPGRGECHSSYRQAEDSTPINIPVIKLEDVFEKYNLQRCDLLKVNCEGEEYNILLSLPDHLFERIGAMVINFHFFSPDPNKHPHVLGEHLKKKGFTVTRHPHNIFLALRTHE